MHVREAFWAEFVVRRWDAMATLTLTTTPLSPSVLGHILIASFGCDQTVLLALGRVYGGEKINGQSVYYFNRHLSF